MIKTVFSSLLVLTLLWSTPSWAAAGEASPGACGQLDLTICTIEIWLAYDKEPLNKEIRGYLKSRSIKVLRKTIQYWKPKGGHPPTNIAIGSGLSVEDARWAIDLALKYNDNIDGLIHQRLNPPNYVAIATSAWDEKSEAKISPEQLQSLRDSKLTTEEFHALYRKLTGEEGLPGRFY
ncbi:MAG: hypothetical protein COV67_05580 [Nitrospinae bacterium CG11_big_fil_rev_8_21_14_0_20_56_8]|nr:MAG: hypothetical protein COV67_05580 [Nitrospinae bacterium CG11_big_fil_rev_8_21_14_0_20_56_8]